MKIQNIVKLEEGTKVETDKGDITLKKFGLDLVSIHSLPYGFNKECETYIKLKRAIINQEDLSPFIGQSFNLHSL
jgi:hypothetical protein